MSGLGDLGVPSCELTAGLKLKQSGMAVRNLEHGCEILSPWLNFADAFMSVNT